MTDQLSVRRHDSLECGMETKGTTTFSPASQPDHTEEKVKGAQLKGILKVRSESTFDLSETDVHETSKQQSDSADGKNDDLPEKQRRPGGEFVHFSQCYNNPAFETDEAGTRETRFSDIVEQVLEQSSLNSRHDIHPFGRGTALEDIFQKKTDSDKALLDSGKLILWFIFAICMLGMAGGIILLSETYKSRVTPQVTNVNRTS